ncbi:MAG TPA: DISARM system helicase DrmA [Ktedonobacterales bacterium]|jgi:hypothetical protein
METIILPAVVPGDLNLLLLNLRLHRGEARLDWSGVQEAPADALKVLFTGLDLVKDADALGIETVPDHLAEAISASLDGNTQPSGRPHRSTTRRTLWDDTSQPDLFEEAEAEEPAEEPLTEEEERTPAEDAAASTSPEPPKALLAAPPPVKMREELEQLVLNDLLGPAGGPEEEVDERNITDRYLIGMLAPQRRRIGPDTPEEPERASDQREREWPNPERPGSRSRRPEEDAPPGRRRVVAPEEQDDLAVAGADSAEEGSTESEAQSATFYPSSFGLSFCVDGEASALRMRATWGRYRRVASATLFNPKSGNPKLIWKREPMGGVLEDVPLQVGPLEAMLPDARQPEVIVRGLVRRLGENWIVTLFLVNTQREPRKLRDLAWIFQPELQVEAPDGAPIFCRQTGLATKVAPEVPTGHEARLRGLGAGAGEWGEPAQAGLVAQPQGATLVASAAPDEEQAMAMLYRQRVEFAVGHGVSIHTETAPGQPDRAVRIRTRIAPTYEVAQTTSPSADDLPGLADLILDMRTLAETADADFASALMPLVTSYAAWIVGQKDRIADPSARLGEYRQTAQHALDACRVTLRRIQAGIDLLGTNAQAAAAFRFLNHAMWQQRVHTLVSEAARRGQPVDLTAVDVPANRTWRPFQLAFILLNLLSLTDLRHPERGAAPDAVADLLWFPTGGGKTEAYLGLTAYTLAIRRLQGTVGGRSGEEGVAVLMRYTLRLLTIQQFQRATALICACEVIRREALDRGDTRWGTTPFRIGLWVGQRTTPNWTSDSAEAVRLDHGQFRRGSSLGGSGSPAQLTNCPWCGAKIDPGRHIKVDPYNQGAGRTFIYCGEPLGNCPFSQRLAPEEGLPVLVVDEEIYRRLPSLLIATVDKFAQMPWNGAVGMLFGQVNGYCPRHGFRSPEIEDSDLHPRRNGLPMVRTEPRGPLRPPDLIIQDELHLISGPLGTLVGLYESVIDRLASWEVDGRTVRPKVIASTATIRHAPAQVHALFLRQVQVFPPQGLDVEDNFFSLQRPPGEQYPGRRYLGICAPGHKLKNVLIRVYVAFLSAGQVLYERYGRAADPWMTLVGYFNSIRELAGARRLIDDDVRSRLGKMNARGLAKRLAGSIEELTSRKSSTDIPKVLDRLEVVFDPIDEAERQAARKAGKGSEKRRPYDVLLATNMVSVGVDVKRLGLMVVAGQPKTTAEYIQATSRIGRSQPGLVCAVLNWARPRDLSHYEQFEHYHATFYQHVEALSVTPFSARALDRGLSALLVAYVRLLGLEFNENAHAGRITGGHPYLQQAIADLTGRARLITGDSEAGDFVRRELEERIDAWLETARRATGGRILGYRDRSDGKTLGLLRAPDLRAWQPFTCLTSLRDVEPMIRLILDERSLESGPERPLVPVARLEPEGEQEA